ncbi:MAG: hypothetical protein C0397_19450, partial [Odoribacter sp.]|nr:hypothetical protein [Odoribacter sp.]
QMLWWVNLVLLASFLTQASTGMFHDAIAFRIFEPLHSFNGWLLVILAVSHIVLNWNWIKTNFIARFI